MPRDSILSLIIEQLPSGQVINYHFHTYCSIIGRSIIRRSINCRVYVLTYLLSVASLFCLSMFCRTAQNISSLDFICTRRLNEPLTNSLGPVVQSIVILTSSLGGQLVKCFATL